MIRGPQGPRASWGLKVVLATVLVVHQLYLEVPLALWVTRGLQDFEELQGPRGREERKVHLETQECVDNRVWVDFQVSKGSKVRREISQWWILKVRKETEVSRALRADKDSQGEEDWMDPRGPLETPAHREIVLLVPLEKEASLDSQGQRDYQDLQAPGGEV